MESSAAELRSLENAPDSCCTLHIVPILPYQVHTISSSVMNLAFSLHACIMVHNILLRCYAGMELQCIIHLWVILMLRKLQCHNYCEPGFIDTTDATYVSSSVIIIVDQAI